jgi:hypothetical protein
MWAIGHSEICVPSVVVRTLDGLCRLADAARRDVRDLACLRWKMFGPAGPSGAQRSGAGYCTAGGHGTGSTGEESVNAFAERA